MKPYFTRACAAVGLLAFAGCGPEPIKPMPQVTGECWERMRQIALGGPETDEIRNLLPTRRIAPTHPSSAFRKGLQGYACFDVELTREGAVRDVASVAAVPDDSFADAGREALMQWQYPPTAETAKLPEPRKVFVFLPFSLPPQREINAPLASEGPPVPAEPSAPAP